MQASITTKSVIVCERSFFFFDYSTKEKKPTLTSHFWSLDPMFVREYSQRNIVQSILQERNNFKR